MQWKSVINLIAVAVCEVILDTAHHGFIVGKADRGLPVVDRTGWRDGLLGDQRAPITDRRRLFIQAKPEQRQIRYRIMHGQIVGGGGFVADESRCVLAVLYYRSFNGLERRNHLIRPPGDHNTHWLSEVETASTLLKPHGVGCYQDAAIIVHHHCACLW